MQPIHSYFFIVLLGAMLSTSSHLALAKKGGGGKPDPTPTICTDDFPSFAYMQSGTRKSPAVIYLASADGCRREEVVQGPNLRGEPTMYWALDGLSGNLLWTKESEDGGIYSVWKRRFYFDGMGDFTLDVATELQLESDDYVTQDGLYYFDLDVGGSRYLVARRVVVDGDQRDTSLRIYDINSSADGMLAQITIDPWSCDQGDFAHPEFVPTCYSQGNSRWNAPGTYLYVRGGFVDTLDGMSWLGMLRVSINTDTSGSLSVGSTKLVYTGTSGDVDADYQEPSRAVVRPPTTEPSPEYIAMHYLDYTGGYTIAVGAVLDADKCVSDYELLALLDRGPDDPVYPANAYWMNCIDPAFVSGYQIINTPLLAWQSAETMIFRKLERKDKLYRLYLVDVDEEAQAGDSVLLVEDGTSADTGL